MHVAYAIATIVAAAGLLLMVMGLRDLHRCRIQLSISYQRGAGEFCSGMILFIGVFLLYTI